MVIGLQQSRQRLTATATFSTILACLVATIAGGCAGRGPRAIQRDHFSYNEAIVLTSNEQMLLNLVRLKYRDTPFFLQVSSVSTQYSFSGDASIGVAVPDGGDNLYSGGLGVSYSEAPTVSYAPLQGDEFVERLLSPVSLEALTLLTGSGWSVERVMRTCVHRINDIQNAPGASGPTPAYVPPYEDFRKVTATLRKLQIARSTALERVATDENRILGRLRFRLNAETAEAAKEFKRLFDLPLDLNEFPVNLDPAVRKPGELTVVTRSLLGVLYYLSQGVEAPAEHEQSGLVTVTRYEDGTPFDWAEVTGGLFRVRTQSNRPDNAFVRVFHRGRWFFIDDSDLDSKSTFGLLMLLFDLQAGSTDTIAPVLTLPVGN